MFPAITMPPTCNPTRWRRRLVVVLVIVATAGAAYLVWRIARTPHAAGA